MILKHSLSTFASQTIDNGRFTNSYGTIIVTLQRALIFDNKKTKKESFKISYYLLFFFALFFYLS